MRKHRTRTFAVLAVVVIVATASVASAIGAGHFTAAGEHRIHRLANGSIAVPVSSQLLGHRVKAAGAPLSKRFDVFKRSGTRRSHFHGRAARIASIVAASPPSMPGPVVQRLGLDLGNVQYVDLGGGLYVWLYPGTNGACMLWPKADNPSGSGFVGSGDCNSQLSSIDLGNMVGEDPSTPGTGGKTVIGLAPDGVTSARVTLADGTTKSASVANNVYAVPVGDAGFTKVTLAGTGPAAGQTIPGNS